MSIVNQHKSIVHRKQHTQRIMEHSCMFFMLRAFLLILFKSASGTGSTIVCLYGGDNHCTDVTCTENYTNTTSDLPAGNLTIQICSTEYQLEQSIMIVNQTGLAVQGLPSLITCRRSSVGIHFDGIKTLVLRDVEFQACGAVFNAPSYHRYTIWWSLEAVFTSPRAPTLP